jgi:hypothetical protein
MAYHMRKSTRTGCWITSCEGLAISIWQFIDVIKYTNLGLINIGMCSRLSLVGRERYWFDD